MRPAITLVNLVRSDRPGERLLPLGCLALRAALEARGMGVDLRDLQFVDDETFADPDRLADHLGDTHPVVGLSLMVDALPLGVELARRLKQLRPETIVVLGGPATAGVSARLVRAFPWLDVVVRGEGDTVLPALLEVLAAGPPDAAALETVAGLDARVGDAMVHTPDAPLVARLDTLADPRLDDLDLSAYGYYTTVTSRGCPYGCRFCDIPARQRERVRTRGVDRVVAELARVHERHGVRFVGFQDDIFLLSRRRVEAILSGLEKAGVSVQWGCFARVDRVDRPWLATLARRGLEHVSFGVESGSDAVLSRIGKRQAVAGAMAAVEAACAETAVTAFFLWGFADETLEDLLATVQAYHHAAYLGAHGQFGQVVPLAASLLYRDFDGTLEWHDSYPFGRIVSLPPPGPLRDRVRDHPDVFPAFRAFPTPHRAEKWEVVGRVGTTGATRP